MDSPIAHLRCGESGARSPAVSSLYQTNVVGFLLAIAAQFAISPFIRHSRFGNR
jgi:hypothetical protein